MPAQLDKSGGVTKDTPDFAQEISDLQSGTSSCSLHSDTSHTACAGRARSPPRTSHIKLSPNSKLADAIVHYGLPRDIKAYLRTKASSINSPRQHMPGQAMTSCTGSTLGLNGIMSKQSATAQPSSRRNGLLPTAHWQDCIAGCQLASLYGNCR